MVSVSGVRGTIGGTLTPHIACDFGLAFARMLKAGAAGARPTVAVGRDTRRSGDMMFNAVAAGLTAGGVDVIDLGVVTTPGAALATSRLKAQGGVVITASHNPIVYNGIKFLQPKGRGLRRRLPRSSRRYGRRGNSISLPSKTSACSGPKPARTAGMSMPCARWSI